MKLSVKLTDLKPKEVKALWTWLYSKDILAVWTDPETLFEEFKKFEQYYGVQEE